VQLLHVQRFHAEILERFARAGGDVVGWEDVAEFVAGLAGPLVIHRGFFVPRRAIAADFVFQRLTDHALAVAVAIGEAVSKNVMPCSTASRSALRPSLSSTPRHIRRQDPRRRSRFR